MVDQKIVDKVREMKGQGYQNSQIIDTLQKDGTTSSDIFDAINQANIADGGPQTTPEQTGGMDLPPPPSFEGNDAFSAPLPPDDDMPAPPIAPAPSKPAAAPPPQPNTPTTSQPTPKPEPVTPSMLAGSSSSTQHNTSQQTTSPNHYSSAAPSHSSRNTTSDVSTEEYVEAIIEEKWVELEDDVQKIVDWKNRSEQRITQLSQEVTDLKDRFEKLHSALIGKIDSYDKNILEVGAEIKAMEKVFSKVLPVFTDNVKQLQDITDDLGKKSKQ